MVTKWVACQTSLSRHSNGCIYCLRPTINVAINVVTINVCVPGSEQQLQFDGEIFDISAATICAAEEARQSWFNMKSGSPLQRAINEIAGSSALVSIFGMNLRAMIQQLESRWQILQRKF